MGEPISYSDHLAHILEGLGSEYNAFITAIQNNTRILVPNSPKYKLISCKWVYQIKLKLDDSIERYKARLVACGFD